MAAKHSITAGQCRAARGFLNCSRDELAALSGVAVRTIVDFERGARSPRGSTLQALRKSLETAGVEFTFENSDTVGVLMTHV